MGRHRHMAGTYVQAINARHKGHLHKIQVMQGRAGIPNHSSGCGHTSPPRQAETMQVAGSRHIRHGEGKGCVQAGKDCK